MPVFGGTTEPGADAFRPCPDCGADQIYSESEGLFRETRYFCDACGHEAEKGEVKKSFAELVEEARADADSGHTPDADPSVKTVCRECREEVSEDVTRCPHCGWKPKKRGGLWWGTTAAMSLNPVGWAMGAKGLNDARKARKGVWERVAVDESDRDPGPAETAPEDDPIEALERLKELADRGVISEAEFEAKKAELLDEI